MSVDQSAFESVVARLEAVAERLESAASGKGGGAGKGPAAAPVEDDCELALAFDMYVKEKMPPLLEAAKETDAPDVLEASQFFEQACKILRDLMAATGKCAKPKDADWPKILTPATELSQKAGKACDNRSDFFQNRKAAAEAMGIMMLPVAPSPPGHAQNTFEAMDFHAIKVMQKKNEKETAWIKLLKGFIVDLKPWCTENCKMGLVWKHGGEDAAAYFAAKPAGSGGGAAPAKGKGKGKAAAPPPPKNPPSKPIGGGSAPAPSGGGMTEVFNAINNFSMGNLKKVTADMKTKNQPKTEGSSVVPAAKAPAAKAFAPAGRAGKGPRGEPKMELQKGTNWMVENYEGRNDLTMDDVEQKQIVVILNCKNVTLRINSPKVKSVCVDSCERVNVIMADVISTVELVNSDRCNVQTTGKVNSFAIDKCDGVNIRLSKQSLAAEIVTSKSSEMNLTVPDEEGADELDTIEIPIPEQFVTKLVGAKKLKTEVSSLYS